MALSKTQANFDAESEYKAIEQTLIGSPRGRWFLSEHGRRARRLDSLTLHDAIARLQDSLREPPALLGQLKTEIEGLQSLLHETRDAIASKQPKTIAGASPEVTSAAVPQGAGATTSAGSILSVAESIHSLAWDLQAQDLNLEACEQIARQASQMYALSHRHAVESERVRTLTDALDGALERLDGLLETVALEAQFDSINPPSQPFDLDATSKPLSESADDGSGIGDVPGLEESESAPEPEFAAAPRATDVNALEADHPEAEPAQTAAKAEEMDAFDLALAKARAQEQGSDPDAA